MANLAPLTLREMLVDHFMTGYPGLTLKKLATRMNVPLTRLQQVLEGTHAIDTALAQKLGTQFGNSAQFWLNLQKHFDTRAC